ncbi:hypothetical protein K0B96_06520 [Horticoccus luteus]|uniref:Uncharacterized protein n=1 Tax=Horticoccus luteus TaxID=2862869 RepID=A0A8F9TXY1_9BACT|nr:hypothetical protein [Horticoccus luteus]QYM80263.1 hypothetical protein K0B96_06520 [Horticoccus luteus]
MTASEQEMIRLGHVQDHLQCVNARIRTYRAIANTTSSAVVAEHFHQCADDLAAAEQKIGQRVMGFADVR